MPPVKRVDKLSVRTSTNLLDWQAVEARVDEYFSLYDHENKSQALAHVVLEFLLGIEVDEIVDSITDGSDDRGLDAVYVDSRAEDRVIYLFQFKHVNHFEKSQSNFPSNEIDKLATLVDDILSDNLSKETVNKLVWAKASEIHAALKQEAGVWTFKIHLCGNMLPLTSAQRQRFENTFAKYRTFEVEEYDLSRIADGLVERHKKKIDREIRLVDKNYFDRSDGNIRGLIGTVEAEQIASLIASKDDKEKVELSIFDDNVRIYLTQKNKINRKIVDTIKSEKRSEFWYLNNGITLICDSFSYQPGVRNPVVVLRNVQVVNGGQTSNAIFEAFHDDRSMLEDVLVLLRIYETKNDDISVRIAESTNSQTPIKSRDLRSNDPLQERIAETCLANGFFYERKARQFSGKPKSKRIDALQGAQAYTAYVLGQPEVSKKDQGRLFGDFYDTVFAPDFSVSALIASVEVWNNILMRKAAIRLKLRKREKVSESESVLVDGAYHVLYAVGELCRDGGVDPLDPKLSIPLVPKAIELVSRAVKMERDKDSDSYSDNRFFKDAQTKGKILRCFRKASTVKKVAQKVVSG